MLYPTAFKTPAGEAAFLAAYDAALKHWAVPCDELEIPGTFGTTHVVVAGPPDAPPLVLPHEWLTTSAMWAPNIADLGRAHRVYAIDVMGQPSRSIPGEPIQTLIRDPVATLDRGRRLIPHFEGDIVPGASHDMCFSQHRPVDARIRELLGQASGTDRRTDSAA